MSNGDATCMTLVKINGGGVPRLLTFSACYMLVPDQTVFNSVWNDFLSVYNRLAIALVVQLGSLTDFH